MKTNLQIIFEEAELRQDILAKEIGISESYLSLIVTGKRKMPFAVAAHLAKKSGRSIELIWGAYIESRPQKGDK